MKFEIIDKKTGQIESDLELIFVQEDALNQVADKAVLDRMKFKAEAESIAYLPEAGRIYAGLGKECDALTDTAAAAVKKALATDATSIKVALGCNDQLEAGVKALVDGILLGAYVFDKYKSKKDTCTLEKIYISTEATGGVSVDTSLIQKIVDERVKVCESVNFTRDIINSMPDEVTPVRLAEIAEAMAKENGLECNIYDEKYLQQKNMNAFWSVARASAHPPRLIHLAYKPKNARKKVVLVGKGLTYDSGGLSLKPGDYMVTMKADKSGASAVLGIIKAVAAIGLDIEVHVVAGAAENMIGGNAYKPDDVLVSRSGKTIEVRNTDAEGRLVLADCLTFAQEELEPDLIVDMATLTGACVVAVGEYTTGVMGHSEALKASMVTAAEQGGELAATLQFNKYLKKLLKSEVADISNISSSRYGGAITAALFLSEFIEEEYKDKWIHLDIAGPAYVEKTWGCNPYGASGAGVRMVVEWLKSL